VQHIPKLEKYVPNDRKIWVPNGRKIAKWFFDNSKMAMEFSILGPQKDTKIGILVRIFGI
jgi:hypothetical protein